MVFIQHIGITCQDIKKSEEFYTNAFGLEKLWETQTSESDMEQIFGIKSPAKIVALKAENSMIELFSFDLHQSPSMGSITHFALFVGNRKDKFEELKKIGADTIEVDRGEGRFAYFVKDPDGVLIELRE